MANSISNLDSTPLHFYKRPSCLLSKSPLHDVFFFRQSLSTAYKMAIISSVYNSQKAHLHLTSQKLPFFQWFSLWEKIEKVIYIPSSKSSCSQLFYYIHLKQILPRSLVISFPSNLILHGIFHKIGTQLKNYIK